MLVGRDVLLAAGDAAVEAALEGRGRLLLLTGEAGIGKTTLALAIAARAEARGALVRTGACWESEGLPPFMPWLDALHRPGGDACAAAAVQLEGVEGHEALDATGAVRARVRRSAEVASALRESAAGRPQVVVLEDLHWADAPSLELLVAVTAQLPTMPVLIIGTYRDDEVAMPSALASLGGNADRLAVAGLDDSSVATLLESVLDRPPTMVEQAAVQRQTGGNPLFVTQVGRLLGSGSSAVPAGVRDVLARRLARTSTGCVGVLGAASVLGVEFDEASLGAMVGSPVAEWLDEATAARLIEPVDGAPGQWRFVHALVQATRYDSLASQERAELHRAAVAALQGRPGVSAAALAHHASRGRFALDDPLPAEALVAAGHEALARLAWPDAAATFEHAVEAAPPGAAGSSLRAEARLGIGAARLRQGRDNARAAFDEVVAVGRAAGRADLVARAALGFSVGLGAFEVRLLDHRQIELLEEAASSLDPADRLLPLVLARLSVALSFVESASRRQELTDRAIELARAAHDPIVLGHALAAWCDARADPEHVAERLSAASEVVVLGQRIGDRPLELLGRRLRVVALLERGDHVLVQSEVAAYERAADAMGDPLYTWYAALWHATHRAAAEGRRDDARALTTEAMEQGALGGSTNSRLLADVHDLMTSVDWRDRAAVDRAMAAMLAAIPEILSPYVDITHAYVATAFGDLDRARHALALLTAVRLDELPRDSEWISAMVQLAYAAARCGHAELTAVARAELEPVADLFAVEGIGAYVHGSVHRLLGLLAAAQDDPVEARRHVVAARAAAAGAGALVEALADLDGAWALQRCGTPEDLVAARTLAREAAARLRPVGLEALAAEADVLGAQAPGVGAPAAGTDEEATAALTRSGDTWEWTWQGRTVHVRHAKGIADLAVLLACRGREVHVRELEGVAGTSGTSHQPALDPTAVDQYRQRLRDLEDDLDEADRHGDLGRAAALAAERDALVDQLTAAFGLAGRSRSVAADPDERLRKAVSARVKASIDRIEQLDPSLGRHLRSSVRTGFWCSYQPERPVGWVVRTS